MQSVSHNLRRSGASVATVAPCERPRPVAVASTPRTESRIAVLTGDSLLAFAVASLATAHFPAVTVIRPDLEDLRAARYLDSRSHALVIVDMALMSELGAEVIGTWLRPFRNVPALLLSATPGAQTLEGFRDIVPLPRDVTPRGLAEAMKLALRRIDACVERRQRPQEIDRITATQWRVVGFLGCGHSNKEIAFRMGISEATVKAHVGAAIARLGLTNRTEVALFAQRLAMGSRWAASASQVDAPV